MDEKRELVEALGETKGDNSKKALARFKSRMKMFFKQVCTCAVLCEEGSADIR